MKISTNWLKDYIDLKNVDLHTLADSITNAGVNVERVEEKINKSHLVVGEIIECENHPNSDHLHVCKVNVGNEVLQIVCGAPNARKGIKVIVSLIGAVLPGDFEIKKSVIRGVESFGMLCALSELGLEEKSDGIHELNEDAVVGGNPFDYLNADDDVIYTLDLNPNRNDCLSHLGFAYEAAATLGCKVKTPEIKYEEENNSILDNYKLEVNTENCSLFLLKLVNDVTIKESPDFIKNRLINAGMRPINNVVDISNYIMLEYGQPLHFYDADKLGSIVQVRMAKSNEILKTLDNKERLLIEDDIVISNGREAIGLAGVMGGYSTEVDENTKNIIVESAMFKPLHIRRTSIRLDLRSEASLRFEKGLNYEYTYEAMERAMTLLSKYADGKIAKDMLLYDNVDKSPKKASITLEKINSCLGLNLREEDVKESFDRLGFEYNSLFDVIIPNRRMDVSIKEDLIEEVGRMYGFHKIVGSLPVQELKRGNYSPRIKYRKDISKRLRSLGLNETRTYTLLKNSDADKYNYDKEELVKLDKPISNDRTHVRSSLIPSLLEVMDYNMARGVSDINIYEIANTYYKKDNEFKENMKLCILLHGNLINNTWNSANIKSDFYTLKGIIDNLLYYLGFQGRCKFECDNMHSFMHPGVSSYITIDGENIGFFGKLNPSIQKKETYVCELNLEKLMNKKAGKSKYTEPSKFPSVKLDVAFIVDNSILAGDIIKEIISIDKTLIKECILFDEYKMNDKRSLAFKLKFESNDHTLEESEINALFNKVIEKVKNKFNAVLRDK